MGSLIYYGALFLAKVLDNALSTTKTILIQRSRWLLAGIAVVLSDFIYFWLTKRIVSGDNNWAILIVSLAGGVGCALACLFSEKLSKDRTYVNVIMSDNLEAMQNFRDFLAAHQQAAVGDRIAHGGRLFPAYGVVADDRRGAGVAGHRFYPVFACLPESGTGGFTAGRIYGCNAFAHLAEYGDNVYPAGCCRLPRYLVSGTPLGKDRAG